MLHDLDPDPTPSPCGPPLPTLHLSGSEMRSKQGSQARRRAWLVGSTGVGWGAFLTSRSRAGLDGKDLAKMALFAPYASGCVGRLRVFK